MWREGSFRCDIDHWEWRWSWSALGRCWHWISSDWKCGQVVSDGVSLRSELIGVDFSSCSSAKESFLSCPVTLLLVSDSALLSFPRS